MRLSTFAPLLVVALGMATPVVAATYGELSQGATGGMGAPMQGNWPTGPYAVAPVPGSCAQCMPMQTPNGAQGMPAPMYDAPGTASLPPSWYMPPEAGLPFAREGHLPGGPVQMWTFGQVNNSTDPYNPWGLSTPFMFVPWSTPLSGWTNAQTWNWWRERSGTRSPAW